MSDKILTQRKAIIGYLRKHPRRGITSIEASDILRITKLTTRISEMRAAGYEFTVVKEHTEDAVFNRYFLAKEPSVNKGFTETLSRPGQQKQRGFIAKIFRIVKCPGCKQMINIRHAMIFVRNGTKFRAYQCNKCGKIIPSHDQSGLNNDKRGNI